MEARIQREIAQWMERYLERKAENQKREEIEQALQKLNQLFWQALEEKCQQAFAQETPVDVLEFDDDEFYFFNFGLFHHEQFGWYEQAVFALQEMMNEQSDYAVLLLTEMLNEHLSKILLVHKEDDLRMDVFENRFRLEAIPNDIDNLNEKLQLAVTKFMQEYNRHRVLVLVQEFQKMALPYYRMEYASQKYGLSTKEDRLQFVQLKNMFNQNENQRNNLLKNAEKPLVIQTIIEQIKTAYQEIVNLENGNQKLQNELKSLQEERKKMDNFMREMRIKEFIESVKGFQKMCALRGNTPQNSFLFQKPQEVINKVEIQKGLEWIRRFDPKLIHNPYTERNGFPVFGLLPGAGNGIFDWQNNQIILPLIPVKDVMTTLCNGIVMYKADVDLETNDRELLNSYSDLPEIKKMRGGIRKTKEKFISDYVLFMTKITHGFGGMEKQKRLWFEQNIAPKKHDIIYPHEFAGISFKEAGDNLENPQYQNDAPETHFARGVFYYHINKFAESIQEFKLVLQEDQSLIDTYYNLGILYKKMNDPQYRDYFQDFIRLAPQTWWTKMAMEHLR